jgi:GT2 family glycosyltransferase
MHRGVVICAYTADRWTLLERAVRSVERQDLGCELVIVIDHNEELLTRARARWPAHAVAPNNFARGLSGARNTGVGILPDVDVVAFLDDDAEASGDWLRALTAPFEESTVGLVGGEVEAEWAVGPPAWFPPEFLWVVGCSYVGLPEQPADVRNPIGASMAVRRTVFDDVGSFVHGIGRIGRVPLGCEETELSIRAARHGYRVRYEPSSHVRHYVPASRATVRYFVRRCYAEGISKAAVAGSVGSGPALEAERRYVTRTLPNGVLGSLTAGRSASIRRAPMILVGCAAACVGYVVGGMTRMRRPTETSDAPRLAEAA